MINIVCFSWIFYNSIEYCLHKLSHYPKTGFLYKIHKKHHTIYYPSNKLMDTGEYKTGYTCGLPDGLIAHGPPTILMIGSLYFFLEYDFFIKSAVNILLFAYISDYFHTQIHIKNSWLEKYYFFNRLRFLHFNHHKDTKKNFNILITNYDKLYSTFKE